MRRIPLPLLLLALTAVVLVGCSSGGDEPEAAPLEWPGDPDTTTEVIDLGAGFSVDAPGSWTLRQAFEVPVAPAEECGSVSASIDAGAGVFVSFTLPAAACADAGEPILPLNGEHGDYVSVDDVGAPIGTDTTASDLGEVSTFEQDYEECTQECVVTRDQIALVALTVPIEPDRPTLMIRADAVDVSVERMLALVEALSFE